MDEGSGGRGERGEENSFGLGRWEDTKGDWNVQASDVDHDIVSWEVVEDITEGFVAKGKEA